MKNTDKQQREFRIKFIIIGILSVLIICSIIFGTMKIVGERRETGNVDLSAEVLQYEDIVKKYASEYEIEAYVPLINAVMMQESRGRGDDPMQSSACPYNTEYSGAITDPEYSIHVGIQYLKSCLERSGCESPQDIEHIRLALQGYNYGAGYIEWAQKNDGGYTEANAQAFSAMMKEKYGWSGYGDTQYVFHVLRFYGYEE